LQTSQHDREDSSEAADSSGSERLRQDSDRVGATWLRDDWPSPVGYIDELSMTNRKAIVQGEELDFVRIEVSKMRLSHMAALRILQGAKLSDVLIPNHRLSFGDITKARPTAHLVVHVGPWEPWLFPMCLRDLVLVKLREVPERLSPQDVLGALAEDALELYVRSLAPKTY